MMSRGWVNDSIIQEKETVKGSNTVNYSYRVLMRFTFELRKEERKKEKRTESPSIK